MPNMDWLGQLALSGFGLPGAAVGLGFRYGANPSFEDLYSQHLGDIPGLGGAPGFERTSGPRLSSFDRFGESQIRQAESLLQPQLEFALANARRGMSRGLGSVGAGTAAGGLSPAAAAALANQVRSAGGQERAAIESGFSGSVASLGMDIFGADLASAEAEQAAQFGLFDRLFGQEQFAAEFGRASAMDRFNAELQRRVLAGSLANSSIAGTPGNIWDYIGGLGHSMIGTEMDALGSLAGGGFPLG